MNQVHANETLCGYYLRLSIIFKIYMNYYKFIKLRYFKVTTKL